MPRLITALISSFCMACAEMRYFYVFLATVLIANPALAQSEIDLNFMPPDWHVQNDTSNGLNLLKFEGKENSQFRFTYYFQGGTADQTQITVWLNAASQTSFSQFLDGNVVFTPHDCWPSIGDCRYVKTYDDGTTESYFTETEIIGTIRHMKTYVMAENGPFLLYEECFVLDIYGFSAIRYQYDFLNNQTYWSRPHQTYFSRARQSNGFEMPVTMQQLRDQCSAPNLTS